MVTLDIFQLGGIEVLLITTSQPDFLFTHITENFSSSNPSQGFQQPLCIMIVAISIIEPGKNTQ